ncbi:hypothetical protein ACXJJ3_20770 [Kribbella sp. WER1]
MADVTVELHRSGFAEWPYEVAFGLSEHTLWGFVLFPIAFLVSLLAHLLVYRGGWTLHVYTEHSHTKVRYRRKADALADIPRQKALAAAVPPPEPVRLPTRGGSLRRPW